MQTHQSERQQRWSEQCGQQRCRSTDHRGDRQLVSCLDCVFSSNCPLGFSVVSVCAGSPNTSKTESARTEVGRCDQADCAFFLVDVVAADELQGSSAELGAEAESDTNVVVKFLRKREEAKTICRTGDGCELAARAFEFINRNACPEGTSVIGVTDRVEQSVRGKNVRLAREAIVPPAVELTDLQAAEFDEGLVNKTLEDEDEPLSALPRRPMKPRRAPSSVSVRVSTSN